LLLVSARTDAAAGDLASAEATLRRLLQLDPGRLEAYGLLGQMYVRQNKVAQAIAEFEQVLARNPKAVWPNTLIGMLHEQSNRPKEAQARYEQALALDPKAGVAANNLAWLMAQNGGDLNVALTHAQAARAQLPESPDVSDTLGWIYYKMDLHTQAVSAFRDAVEKQPGRADFQYHLGLASARTSDFRVARTALETALKLNPNAAVASEAKAALSKLTVLGS
jgi:tetratricopeptide (TPR) repeat protein